MAKKLGKVRKPEEKMEEMPMDFEEFGAEDEMGDEEEFEMPEEDMEMPEEELEPSDPMALMDQLEEMGYDVSDLRKQEPEEGMEEEEDMDLEEEEEGEL